MARYTTTIDVAADPATVFAFLEDFTNAEDWDPGVAAARRLDDGPVEVGSRFALDLAFAGRSLTWVYEVTEHDAPQRVTFTADEGTASGRDQVTVVATGDGCQVTWDATVELKVPFGGLVDPLFGLVFTRIADKATDGLRAALAGIAAAT